MLACGYTFECLEGLLKDAKCLAFDLSGFVADCEISDEVRAYVLARALDLAAAAVGRPLPAEPAPPDEDDGGITLLPHRTAELEGLADAFADAEADFLGQFESAECPYCGEEAFVTPLGRVVCSCWTNPALEICEDIKAQRAQEAQKANGGKP